MYEHIQTGHVITGFAYTLLTEPEKLKYRLRNVSTSMSSSSDETNVLPANLDSPILEGDEVFSPSIFPEDEMPSGNIEEFGGFGGGDGGGGGATGGWGDSDSGSSYDSGSSDSSSSD